MSGPPDAAAGEPEQWLATAHALADLARAVSLRWFRTPLDIHVKADHSPVTQADREVEALMREQIGLRHPTHGIVGEEHGDTRADAPLVWYLDPIDGTKSFVCGLPLWGTLIALVQDGVPVLGLIDAPVLGERWSALRDGPAWFGATGHTPQACTASACRELADARLCMPVPDNLGPAGRAAVEHLAEKVAVVRCGGDCYGYALVASGHLDIVVESGLDAHDFLPMVPIIEAAGGVITDWQGRPLGPQRAGDVVAAATHALHRQAIQRLAPRSR
ncbi:MAG: inositol monophosphatase family protein [Burkholderiales bacterium]|nr:MAG: inositol monophosphatase family protein [Burkholderiales bacterium]